MKKWLLRLLLIAAGVVVLAVAVALYNVRDRHAGYSLDLTVTPAQEPGRLQAGFAALPITPEVVDTWSDANHDARYREEDGDTFDDRNGNGKFDAYWIAGFHNRRPAAGVHDDLWARAMVLDDGKTRMALVVLDAIGFLHDDVLDVRKMLPAASEIDYLIVCSTHVHEAPDLIGIWGGSYFKSGVNREYLQFVKEQAVQAAVQAAAHLRPARLRFAQDLEGARKLVIDTRKPEVFDAGLRLIQAIDAAADTTLGTLVAWANHPETLWSRNLLITSDFPHFVRKAVEKGIYKDGQVEISGLGGVAIYVNGAIGGLMTTGREYPIRDFVQDTVFSRPTFARAKAQGEQLAWLALSALRGPNATTIETGSIALQAKSIYIPMTNKIFRLAAVLKVIDKGFAQWLKIRTEVAAFRLGPASFIAVPGEIYPEIVNGGIDTPEGQDFASAPVEVPPLRELMPGTYRFVLGLANDEIGYIIPKSEWDEEPPYLYGAKGSPYGEINSIGPDAGPAVHGAIKDLLENLQQY